MIFVGFDVGLIDDMGINVEFNFFCGNVVSDFFVGQFIVNIGSIFNFFDGEVGDGFEVFFGSMINLFGVVFLFDGLLLDMLILDGVFIINDCDVMLLGILVDGLLFSFDFMFFSG